MNDRNRKILEFAGFWKMTWSNGNFQWHTPNDKPCDPPEIDLNFLAEEVFPRLQEQGFQIDIVLFEQSGCNVAIFNVIRSESDIHEGKDNDLLEACLQAVEQAIK